jgi:hypothetical protein
MVAAGSLKKLGIPEIIYTDRPQKTPTPKLG